MLPKISTTEQVRQDAIAYIIQSKCYIIGLQLQELVNRKVFLITQIQDGEEKRGGMTIDGIPLEGGGELGWEIEYLEEKITDKKRAIEQGEWFINEGPTELKTISTKYKQLNDENEAMINQIFYRDNNKSIIKKSFIVFILFLILFAPIMSIPFLILFGITDNFSITDNSFWILNVFLSFIPFKIYKKYATSKSKAKIRKNRLGYYTFQVQELNKQEEKLKQSIIDWKEKLPKFQEEYKELSHQLQLLMQQREQVYIELEQIQIMQTNLIQTADFQELYRQFPIEYVEALKVGDTGYFDLTLYFLDSRKADTLKEAYLRVDEYKFRQNLTQYIQSMRQELTHMRERVINDLALINTKIDKEFSNLQKQIKQNRDEIESKIHQTQNDITKTQNLANLASQQAHTALILSKNRNFY